MADQPAQQTNPIDQQRAQEKTKRENNLYNISTGEIFRKNFLAGFARTLGGVVVYLLFLAVTSFLVSKFLLPQLPKLLQSISPVLSPAGGISPGTDPNQIQDLFDQFNR